MRTSRVLPRKWHDEMEDTLTRMAHLGVKRVVPQRQQTFYEDTGEYVELGIGSVVRRSPRPTRGP